MYNETAELNFFIEFMKKCFRSATEFRYIFDLKLIIYSIAVDIEHSTGDFYSPWITT